MKTKTAEQIETYQKQAKGRTINTSALSFTTRTACLQMASVSEDSDGVITKKLLKTRSGEFDVESIHAICLRETGITDLGCISECVTLERLDLSFNDISRLHKLAGLNLLRYLNISANRITSLDGLQALDNLQNLNVAGNLIGSVDCFRSLSGLEHLTQLRLKDETTGLSNPLCNSSYFDDVLIMLPTLTTLDGLRVRGKGSELFREFQDFESKLNAFQPVSIEKSHTSSLQEQDVSGSQWVVDDNKVDSVFEAENEFKVLLNSCKKLYEDALQQFEKDSNRKPKDTYLTDPSS